MSHNHFFSGLDGHRNQLNVILFLKLLWVWFFHALAHGTYHARIVYPKYFNHRIALAELFYAIRDGETPGFLVPGHPQGGIAIPIVGNVDFSAHAGNGLDQFCDALDAGVPLAVKFLGVRFQPGFNGGKTPNNLLFTDFHGTAHGALEGAGITQGPFN